MAAHAVAVAVDLQDGAAGRSVQVRGAGTAGRALTFASSSSPDAARAAFVTDQAFPAGSELKFIFQREDAWAGHEQNRRAILTQVEGRTPAGAATLSLLVPGLGQVFVGEHWRGGVFLAGFLLIGIAGLIVGVAALSFVVGVLSAVDAYRAARLSDDGNPPRQIEPRLWTLLVAALLLVAVALALS